MSRSSRSAATRPALTGVGMAVIAAGAATAIFAAIAAWQIGVAGDGPIILPLSASYDAAARKVIEDDPVRAKALTRKALAADAADAEAWLRLATLEVKDGQLTPGGQRALTAAYDLAPYHPGLLAARTAFAFDHWTELSPALRKQVRSEMRASWKIGPLRPRLFEAANAAQEPRGRVELALVLFHLRMDELVRWSERKAEARQAKDARKAAREAAAARD